MNIAVKLHEVDRLVPFAKPQTEKSSISVVGLGYVGAVSSACLASLGHRVVGVDVDRTKVRQIAKGISPIHEKDLGRLLNSGVQDELISATTSIADVSRNDDSS